MRQTLFLIAFIGLLSGLSFGATTITYDHLLDSSDGWTITKGRTQGNDLQISDGTASCPNSNWNQAAASYTLGTAINLTAPEDTLTFSFTLTTNGTINAAAMLTFVGSDSALSVGMSRYDGGGGAIDYATSDNTTARAYSFQSAWDNDGTVVGDYNTLVTTGASASTTITGNIAWANEQFVLTLSSGETSATMDLGSTFSLEKLVLNIDGPNASTVPSISNVSITANIVPEPTTAALGLLATVGLLVRKRKAAC